MKYKGLNTQNPYSGSYPPEQTYVCGLILGIVVCPLFMPDRSQA